MSVCQLKGCGLVLGKYGTKNSGRYICPIHGVVGGYGTTGMTGASTVGGAGGGCSSSSSKPYEKPEDAEVCWRQE